MRKEKSNPFQIGLKEPLTPLFNRETATRSKNNPL